MRELGRVRSCERDMMHLLASIQCPLYRAQCRLDSNGRMRVQNVMAVVLSARRRGLRAVGRMAICLRRRKLGCVVCRLDGLDGLFVTDPFAFEVLLRRRENLLLHTEASIRFQLI